VQCGLFGTPRGTLTPRSPVAAVQAASGLDADCLIHRMRRRRGSRRCYRDCAYRVWVQCGLFGTPRGTLTPRSPVAAVQAASGLDADCLIHRMRRRRGLRRCYRDGACRVCVQSGLFGTPRKTLTPRSPVAAVQAASGCNAVCMVHRVYRLTRLAPLLQGCGSGCEGYFLSGRA